MISNALRKKRMGQVLKTLREKSYISRAILSQVTGISSSTICRIENGQSNVGAYSFDRLCSFFNLYPEDLLKLPQEKLSEIAKQKRLPAYLLETGTDHQTVMTIKESQASFLKHTKIIDLLLNEGYFKKYKRVSEVRQQILLTYKKDIPSSVISNALKSNANIQSVLATKKNYKLYKVVRVIKAKNTK